MNKLLYIIVLIVLSVSGYAQLIDNKINIYFGYGSGIFHGKELLQEENFIYPSLYSNYNNINGFLLKSIVRNNPYYSLGLNLSFLNASDWYYKNYSDYSYSRLRQYYFSPSIQLHNCFQETGLLNRIKFIVEISPTIGLSSLALKNPLFDIQSENGSTSPPDKSNDLFYGLDASAGLEIAVNKALGIFFNYKVGYYRISSILYQNNHFINSQLVCGVFIRIKKDKRFYY